MAAILNNSTKRVGSVRIRSQNGIPIIEETYSYIVLAESLTESYKSIAQAAGLPRVNSTRSAGGLTLCQSIKGDRRSATALYWDFTAEFSSAVKEDNDGGGGGGTDPDTDPTTWIPVYETKSERLQEIVTEDSAGKAILNSAGDPFETGTTRTRLIPIWEFFQFEKATVTDEQILERNEVVNKTAFLGRDPKTLLLSVERSTIGFYYGKRRRLTKYSLKYNSETWVHKRLDVGTSYKTAAGVRKPYEIDGVVILGALNGTDGQPSGGFDANNKPINDKAATGKLKFDLHEVKEFRSFLRK